jgi:hypothetical protein
VPRSSVPRFSFRCSEIFCSEILGTESRNGEPSFQSAHDRVDPIPPPPQYGWRIMLSASRALVNFPNFWVDECSKFLAGTWEGQSRPLAATRVIVSKFDIWIWSRRRSTLVGIQILSRKYASDSPFRSLKRQRTLFNLCYFLGVGLFAFSGSVRRPSLGRLDD